MSAVRRSFPAYKAPGDENFRHGAETYRMRTGNLEAKRERQRVLNQNLANPHINDRTGLCGSWTEAELKELWRLRYERKPKYTYDQLAKRFHHENTWDVVNALCLLRDRKKSGEDMWKPVITQAYASPTKPYIDHSPKRDSLKILEKTKDIVRMYAQGCKIREIKEAYNMSTGGVWTAIHRMKTKYPSLYNQIIEESKTKK